jgi:hypothetical protein
MPPEPADMRADDGAFDRADRNSYSALWVPELGCSASLSVIGPEMGRARVPAVLCGSMADMKHVAARADETIGAPPGSRYDALAPGGRWLMGA